MFFASNICCVSSGTVTARYCWLPRAVKGAKPVMKKWRRGKGTVEDISLIYDNHQGLQPTHVDSEFTQVRVKLTRETQACRDTGHDNGNEVVEIPVCRCRQLQCPEADVVQRLVVNTEGLIRVLNELVDRERRVVGLTTRVSDTYFK